MAPASGPLGLGDDEVVEWGGALRWLHGDFDAAAVRAAAKAAGGHSTLFRTPAAVVRHAVFTPLEPVPARLHREIKRAFDPAGILNPGRMYAEV